MSEEMTPALSFWSGKATKAKDRGEAHGLRTQNNLSGELSSRLELRDKGGSEQGDSNMDVSTQSMTHMLHRVEPNRTVLGGLRL